MREDLRIIGLEHTGSNTLKVTTTQGVIELPMKYAKGTCVNSVLRVKVVPAGGLLTRLKLAIHTVMHSLRKRFAR